MAVEPFVPRDYLPGELWTAEKVEDLESRLGVYAQEAVEAVEVTLDALVDDAAALPFINVATRGVAWNGSTDDSTLVQQAVDESSVAAFLGIGNGIVQLPPGTGIAEIIAKPFVTVRGAGRYKTTIKPPASSTAAGAVTIPVGNVQAFYLEDVQVLGNGVAGQHGIYFKSLGDGGAPDDGGWWYGGLKRVRIQGFLGHDIWLRGGGTSNLLPHQFLTFEHVDCFAAVGKNALYVTGQVGQATFTNCEFDGPGKATGGSDNVRIRREVNDADTVISDQMAYAINFNTCTFQANDRGALVDRANCVTFDTCHFEDLKRGVAFENSVEMGNVINSRFVDACSDGSATGYGIRAGATSHVRAMGNYFGGAVDETLQVAANSGSIEAAGNYDVNGPIRTSGMTRQPTVTANAIVMDFARSALIASGSSLHTITSRHAPGTIITLRAFSGDFTLTTGGNINLSGNVSPMTVLNGEHVSFVRMDLAVTGWALIGKSLPLNGGLQILSTDVGFTLTPRTSPKHTRHTATMAADRAVTLTTTLAMPNDTWEITRTGGGAFNLNVGTGPLKALVQNTWCEVKFDGTAWYLSRYGAL